MNLCDASVLLVDDEPILLEIFSLWLTGIGCGKVSTAANGEEALAILETKSIDLLLTDVRMPVMDGVTLVRRLAGIGRSLPCIVFVSGFGDVDHREMYSLGAEAFISKPCDRNELLRVVEAAVANRSTLWQNKLTVEPRQSIAIEADDFAETAGETTVGLGRGGFSVCLDKSITPGKVEFRLLLRSPGIEVVGQGFIRWASRTDGKVGIEIAFLNPCCRAWVTERISSAAPRSFIPGS